jgi:GAF domain-containing protein
VLQLRNSIIWRLILWFLLLSLIPIGVVIVFVQRQVRQSTSDLELQNLSENARLLAAQIDLQPARAQDILQEFSKNNQVAFVLRKDGTYFAHPNPDNVGNPASYILSPDIIKQIVEHTNGSINNIDGGQLIGYQYVESQDATVVIIADSNTITNRLDELSRSVTIQLVVSLVITSLAGGAAILTILTPLLRLAEYADALGSGNLDLQFDGTYLEGELATLSNSLTSMASRIRELVNSLEHRAKERTTELAQRTEELEIEHERVGRRAGQLQAISDVAHAITSVQDVDLLLPNITTLISERFGFYHVGVFLVDDKKEFAILRAANSEGGQRMLMRGHKLKVGEVGIVGFVAKTGNSRIALDTEADAVFFHNPDLPDTHSELALPLKIGEKIIGVLDVQSTQPKAFIEEDIEVLNTLADQVAVAIQNAVLFGQTHQALERAEQAYKQFVLHEWGRFINKSPILGYRYSESKLAPITQLSDAPEVEIASKIGKKEESHETLAIPIKSHGEVIGVIGVNAENRNRSWTEDEVAIVQAAADRVSLALESARLLQEAQRRAAKERTISEITSHITASTNMDNILQTAAEELGRIITGSEIVIQFQTTTDGQEQ